MGLTQADLERMTIEFPIPLDNVGIAGLFKHIKGTIPNRYAVANGTVSISNFSDVNLFVERSRLKTFHICTETAITTNFEIQGDFSKEPGLEDDVWRYEGMRLQSVPGWNMGDYDSEGLELLDEVRKVTEAYLAERNSQVSLLDAMKEKGWGEAKD